MTGVLIIARSPVTRAGLSALVREDARFTVTGSVGSAEEAARILESAPPGLMLVELTEEAEDGLLELLTAPEDEDESAAPACVVLAADLQAEWITRLLRSGAHALLPHTATGEEIVASLQAVDAGLIVVHRDAVESLEELRDVAEGQSAQERAAAPGTESFAEPLTAREREVLNMLAEGLGNKEIAWRLKISEHTVKFHASSIFAKLGASSRTEAVTLGIRHGLVML